MEGLAPSLGSVYRQLRVVAPEGRGTAALLGHLRGTLSTENHTRFPSCHPVQLSPGSAARLGQTSLSELARPRHRAGGVDGVNREPGAACTTAPPSMLWLCVSPSSSPPPPHAEASREEGRAQLVLMHQHTAAFGRHRALRKGSLGDFKTSPGEDFFFFFVLKTCHFVRQRKSKKRVVREGWVETVPAACSGFIQASPPLPSETS